ncbi:MAG TPA: hypothetical protein VJ306_24130 [Pyrinomonadaceae bacterium]|jgi:hypothetical protein|nr:hypothetical protein [Pyrinomonadaceae bacterium]
MPEKEETDAVSESKGVAENFIQSLGLLELILGGVGLYGFWLWYGERAAKLFPSTGTKLIDIGLLAFAAALVGKLICLFVAALMGLIWKSIRAADFLGYQANLERAFLRYHGAPNLQDLSVTLGQENPDLRGLAFYYVVLADPKQQDHLERIKTNAIVAYSICVLSLIYIPYLYRAGAPWSMWVGMVLATIVFLFLGYLEQLDYLRTLSERLIGIQTVKSQIGRRAELNPARWHTLIRQR